jgi:hypothetical protein
VSGHFNLATERCHEHGSFRCWRCLGVPQIPGPRGGKGSLTSVVLAKVAYRKHVENCADCAHTAELTPNMVRDKLREEIAAAIRTLQPTEERGDGR